jgi:diacylglycerol O-acyltransferase / wax synthase
MRSLSVPGLSISREEAPKARRKSVLAELSVVAFLVWIYNWIQDVAPLRRVEAVRHGRSLFSFEERLGLDPERALDRWLAHQHLLAYIASSFYAIAIFAVTFGFAAITWWRRPDLYVRLRNEIVLANLLGFIVFLAFPVAPPRMLPGFVDVVARSGALGWHNTLVRHADQLAAMPSMHVGYAVWSSFVAWRLARGGPQRIIALACGVAYSCATALVVLATGNHYLLDVLAGVATVVLSVAVVETVSHFLRRPIRLYRPSLTGVVRLDRLYGEERTVAQAPGLFYGPLEIVDEVAAEADDSTFVALAHTSARQTGMEC